MASLRFPKRFLKINSLCFYWHCDKSARIGQKSDEYHFQDIPIAITCSHQTRKRLRVKNKVRPQSAQDLFRSKLGWRPFFERNMKRLNKSAGRRNVSANLKRLLRQHGMTQQQLAAISGVSQPCISSLLAGSMVVNAIALKNLASAFGVTSDYMLEWHRVEK